MGESIHQESGLLVLRRMFLSLATLVLANKAWTEGGPLLSQPLDNNRFVVLLAEIMCQVGPLVARYCLGPWP